MAPAPTTRHQFVFRNMEHILPSFVRTHHLGTVLYAPVDVVFGQAQKRIQDNVFRHCGKRWEWACHGDGHEVYLSSLKFGCVIDTIYDNVFQP